MERLLTDADNTLWDTNSVYADAQLRLLAEVEEHIGRPVVTGGRLDFVRSVDQAIAVRHSKGLRYPSTLLSEAILAIGIGGRSVIESVTNVLASHGSSEVARKIAQNHSNAVLQTVPPLRIGVLEGLRLLNLEKVRITVFTEGDERRCLTLLDHYDLSRFVSDVKCAKKTVSVYEEIVGSARRTVFMVGDQLDVDIQIAKAAGLKTIYFPSGFTPGWARELENEADFTIATYADVPMLLSRN